MWQSEITINSSGKENSSTPHKSTEEGYRLLCSSHYKFMLSLPHLSHVHSSLLHISHIFLSFPQLQTLSYISISHLLSHRTPKFLHLIQNQPPLFFPCFSFCLCFCAFFIVVCNVFQCVSRPAIMLGASTC